MVRKHNLAIEIYKIVRIHCNVVSATSFFGEKLKFGSQHTNFESYYDDAINYDVVQLVLKDALTNKEEFYQRNKTLKSK